MSDNPATVEEQIFGDLTPPALSVSEEPEPAPEQDDRYDKLLAEHETLKGRYEESGKEGKRRASQTTDLQGQLDSVNAKLEEVKPFLNALEKDPNFVSHISSYYEGPKDVREELGDDLSEFSAADLLDPKSKIGEIFSKRMARQVEDRSRAIVQSEFSTRDKANEETNRKNDMDRQIKTFLKDHPDKDQAYVEDLLDFAAKGTLTLENLDILKNSGEANRRTDQAAREDMKNQMRNVSSMNPSLASNTSTASPNPIDDLFEQMKNQTGKPILPL